MIAPADYLNAAPRCALTTATSVESMLHHDLLPWADPYIAQLFQQHEVELAAGEERRRPRPRPGVCAARRRGLAAVA